MKRVQGKVAIVTGGASGIGLASSQLMAKEGAKVVIADYNLEGAEKAAQELASQGFEAQAMFLDASKEESIKEVVEKTVEAYGTLNVMYNNVGGTNLKKDLDIVNMDMSEWDRGMKMNLDSVVYGCRYAIPHMIKAGGGSIINTASMAAFASDSVRTVYGASKAAVVQLTKYVATQYGKQNIRANAIAPGLILTPAAKNNLPEEMLHMFQKYNALAYHGEPEDIGYTVVFLASDESKFITGQTIQVEGGHYLANPTVPEMRELMAKKQ
ncbi:SDR family NAD(P)-dependent oxidoreductase [Paenibacillus chibensis]|uniref:SDR family NAD(P)-dependent oxidoreductase n=1 Tax=Paenibacillus chibensis TaxID=59846 RepID=UPI000FD974BB|nr:SDR family NAD(P)-dependent oxidoreductase [Paenibacillus chibensis]MEC0368653.1 SDR family NAD(P)-dependent oxidoreductase [Paenibacillus chibensis]